MTDAQLDVQWQRLDPLYPRNWGLKSPDPNIDHRRVPNLMTYFKRQGWTVAVTTKAADFRPGDVVFGSARSPFVCGVYGLAAAHVGSAETQGSVCARVP